MADVRACVRCRVRPEVVQVREAVYCAECYARVFSEKTRSSLELVRGAVLLQSVVQPFQAGLDHGPPPAFAVAYSGGQASSVLLHAVSNMFQSRNQPYVPARAPEFSRIYALFVDDGQMPIEEARDRVAKLAPNASFVPLRLDSVYDTGAVSCILEQRGGPRWLNDDQPASDDAASAFLALLQVIKPENTPRTAIPSAQSRVEDLRKIFMHRVLRRAAEDLGCAALLYGHSAARTAALLLEGISQGAGHKLPIESASSLWWSDSRDLLVVHPLRSHLPEELQFYEASHGLGAGHQRNIASSYEAQADKTSIGRLTQSLIDSLQHGVSSTVSTVAGTGSKLVYRPDRVWQTHSDTAETTQGPAVSLLSIRSDSENKQDEADPTKDSPPFPRIGAKGEGLVRAAEGIQHYDPGAEPNACPLCSYPAQRGASNWRQARSVTSLHPGNATPPKTHGIDLRAKLCYSCIQILDTPEFPAQAQEEGAAHAPLPRYVADALQPRSKKGPRPKNHIPDTLYDSPQQNDTVPHLSGGRSSHASVPVSREAMHASVASYLL
ncbi:Cytoplasmic tRNA 2-thiolation protein 2 [Malassezia psittaci]|uniref:Cytoplasmic tRNA 2-thiolation protein 2 n=1 Tax=Malassezia psittaci TaxID=1821823 RepID=A0AAF0JD40_9BASI|nr:Cytoplasmic tRNA 2-thiolation protein 2 [Malassezia psittaci]